MPRLHIFIDNDIDSRLKAISDETLAPVSKLIQRAISEWIQRRDSATTTPTPTQAPPVAPPVAQPAAAVREGVSLAIPAPTAPIKPRGPAPTPNFNLDVERDQLGNAWLKLDQVAATLAIDVEGVLAMIDPPDDTVLLGGAVCISSLGVAEAIGLAERGQTVPPPALQAFQQWVAAL